MAAKHSETRKLYIYHKDNNFNSTVESVTVLAFVNAADVTVQEKKVDNEKTKNLQKKREWMMQNISPIVIERHTTLRKNPSIVAGAI